VRTRVTAYIRAHTSQNPALMSGDPATPAVVLMILAPSHAGAARMMTVAQLAPLLPCPIECVAEPVIAQFEQRRTAVIMTTADRAVQDIIIGQLIAHVASGITAWWVSIGPLARAAPFRFWTTGGPSL